MKAEEMHVRVCHRRRPGCWSRAQADQGVGLARRSANRRGGGVVRAPARTRARTSWPGASAERVHLRGRPRRNEANTTGLAKRSACRSARPLERDAPGPAPLRRDDHATEHCCSRCIIRQGEQLRFCKEGGSSRFCVRSEPVVQDPCSGGPSAVRVAFAATMLHPARAGRRGGML